MSEPTLSDAWQCQSCGCYFPHIPKILDNDVKRCSKCVEVEILEADNKEADRLLLAAAMKYTGLEARLSKMEPWWHRMSNEDIAAELSATFDLGLDTTRKIADWVLKEEA